MVNGMETSVAESGNKSKSDPTFQTLSESEVKGSEGVEWKRVEVNRIEWNGIDLGSRNQIGKEEDSIYISTIYY